MNEFLRQIFAPDPLSAILRAAPYFLLYILTVLAPTCALLYAVYFILTLPLRRNERARLFVDLLELGLSRGRTPEAAVLEVAWGGDASLGHPFLLLSSYLRQGLRLGPALQRVPRLLPRQLSAMLQTADRAGNLPKILPACRRLLDDAVSQVRGALNYVLVLVVVGSPAMVFLPVLFKLRILPKFVEVSAAMAPNEPMPAFTRLVFGESSWTLPLQAGLCFLMWLAVLAYVAGPRAGCWVGRLAPGLPDRLACCLPWRRKRLQRDFSAVLALLLDAEVPEAEAVTLAAEATANGVIQKRAAKVCRRLSEGVALPEAVRAMDDTGELHWRLSNALRSQGGFLRALAGWHDALDAKAFQMEQGAAQVVSTLLVLVSGAVVGAIVIAIFLVIIRLIQRAISL